MESMKKEAIKAKKSIMKITGILYKGKMEKQHQLLADIVTDDISQYLDNIVAESQKIHDRMMEGQGKLAFSKKRAAENNFVFDESSKYIKNELNNSHESVKII